MAPGPEEEIQRTQNATVFSQRNKADPNWALSEGLSASVDISRVGYRLFYGRFMLQKISVFSYQCGFRLGVKMSHCLTIDFFLMEMAGFDSDDTATS